MQRLYDNYCIYPNGCILVDRIEYQSKLIGNPQKLQQFFTEQFRFYNENLEGNFKYFAKNYMLKIIENELKINKTQCIFNYNKIPNKETISSFYIIEKYEDEKNMFNKLIKDSSYTIYKMVNEGKITIEQKGIKEFRELKNTVLQERGSDDISVNQYYTQLVECINCMIKLWESINNEYVSILNSALTYAKICQDWQKFIQLCNNDYISNDVEEKRNENRPFQSLMTSYYNNAIYKLDIINQELKQYHPQGILQNIRINQYNITETKIPDKMSCYEFIQKRIPSIDEHPDLTALQEKVRTLGYESEQLEQEDEQLQQQLHPLLKQQEILKQQMRENEILKQQMREVSGLLDFLQ